MLPASPVILYSIKSFIMVFDKQKSPRQEEFDESLEQPETVKGEKDIDDLVHRSGQEVEKPESTVDLDEKVHKPKNSLTSHSPMEDPDDRVHQ
jgi:hypothetical protein